MIPESRPFHAFVEPARAGGAWWRMLIGLPVILAIWFGFGFGLVNVIATGIFAPLGLDAGSIALLGAEGRVLPPAGVMIFLLTFLGLWVALAITLRPVHRRRFGTLFGPSGKPKGRALIAGAALALGFYVVSILTYTVVLGPPERTDLPLSIWAIWLIPIVIGIAMQATSEELLFRGYILQQFAVWSRHPLVWAVMPSVVFAALHYDGGMEAGMRWRMLVHILIFGLVTAALVWRTGGLGAAMGLHIANNIFAICGFGIVGSAFGFELWVFPPDTLARMFLFDLGTGFLMLAGVFILFHPEQDR